MKISLGKTPQELEEEEARKRREIEAEIQASVLQRQQKIAALHKKQKTTKIIIIIVVIVISLILLIFGTYNTFFKKGLTIDDVRPEIYNATFGLGFPADGLDNYIRDNCDALFFKYISTNDGGNNIADISVDKNSCNIFKIKKLSNTFAQVYFSVDVSVTKKDSTVTDQDVINDVLKKSAIKELSTSSSSSQIDDSSESSTDKSQENKSDTTVDSNLSTEDSSNIESNNLLATYQDYYILNDGTVMEKGETTTERYNFYVPIEFYYNYDNNTAVTSGYRLAGPMTLYTLVEVDQTDFDDINTHNYYTFPEGTAVDEATLEKIRIKVDKTLSDLYSYRDTSQDFFNYREFNTYDATYVGINYIESYTSTNALGYNTYIEYSITTKQGFNYTLNTYMLVEESGNSYIITQIQ